MPHIRVLSHVHINTPVTLNQYKAQKETVVGAKNIEKTNPFQYNETVAGRPSAIMTRITLQRHSILACFSRRDRCGVFQNKEEVMESTQKKFEHITAAERHKIEGYLKAKMSKAEIARHLHKDYSTICREIKRGTVLQTVREYMDVYVYKAEYAQNIHEERAAAKGRKSKLTTNPELKEKLAEKIKKGYSPEVALHLIKKQEHKIQVNICLKTVYNAIDRKEFKNTLTLKDLPLKKPKKKKKQENDTVHKDIKRRSIEERPEIINKRQTFGHWEMDCVLSGTNTDDKTALVVLTERLTRLHFEFQISQKTQIAVKSVLDFLEIKLNNDFKKIFKSITMDNGAEFMNQSFIETSAIHKENRTTAYYCHPYSAFERGSNENTNLFIRRYVKKGDAISHYTPEDIFRIQAFINHYPRKTFGFESAIERVKQYTDNPVFLRLIGADFKV